MTKTTNYKGFRFIKIVRADGFATVKLVLPTGRVLVRGTIGDAVSALIKHLNLDVYKVPGLGYCGPDWEQAEEIRKSALD